MLDNHKEIQEKPNIMSDNNNNQSKRAMVKNNHITFREQRLI